MTWTKTGNIRGPAGATGAQGPPGQGVPAGGTAGQALVKINATDYNTQWTTIATGSGLPADVVVAAATRIIANKLLAGDAQPAWRVLGSGEFDWGPGGSTAPDTFLYRNGAAWLQTNAQFGSQSIIFANQGFSSQVGLGTRDGSSQAAGITFGGASDTNLYRNLANTLKTDGAFVAGTTIDGDMLQYYGDYVPGSYQDGDIVVQNGVAYLAVRPTTNAPVPWVGGSSAGGADEMAYAEIGTGAISVTTTSEASPTDIITAPAIILDGATRIVVEFYAPYVGPPGTANVSINVSLWMDGVNQGRMAITSTPAAATLYWPMYVQREITPAAGSHTFVIRAWINTGSVAGYVGNGPGGAGNHLPMFIRIRRVGPYSSIPGTVNYGTTLPTSPTDGQRAILVDSVTNPTYQWEFRYNAQSTSTYKWEFVGGAPWCGIYSGAATAVANLTQVGSTGWYYSGSTALALPRSGDYSIGGNALFNPNGAGAGYALIAPFSGANIYGSGGPASPKGEVVFQAGQTYYASVAFPAMTWPALASGAVTGCAVTTPANATFNYQTEHVTIVPVRVS